MMRVRFLKMAGQNEHFIPPSLLLFLAPISLSSNYVYAASLTQQSGYTSSVTTSLVDLSQEKPLQQNVSITAPGIPLADILEMISAQYHVTLSATRPASDQRFTISTHDLPLHLLMRQIVRTLSHTTDGPNEYEWRKTRDEKGKDGYALVALVAASAQKRKAIAAEQERIRFLLREIRALLNSSEKDAQKSPKQSLFPPGFFDPAMTSFSVYHQAVHSLTERDIDALVRGDRVSILPATIKEAVEAHDRDEQNSYMIVVNRLRTGQTPPASPAPTNMAPVVYLLMRPTDWNGQYPGQRAEYALLLEGVFDDHSISLSPYYQSNTPLVSPSSQNESTLDLSAFYSNREKTQQTEANLSSHNLPNTLIAIARASKINIVQEQFYKVDRGSRPLQNVALKQQQGKLTGILDEVCHIWNYTVVKDGEVYCLWSPTWSVDRECDIPERKLAPWRKIVAKQGKLTVDDQVRLATELSWGQIAVTLKQTLFSDKKPERDDPFFIPMGDFPFLNAAEDYGRLRLQGLLNPQERQAAVSQEGIPIAALRPELREEALRTILIASRTPPLPSKIEPIRARLATARLFLKPPSPNFRIPVPWSVEILDAPTPK